MDKWKSLSLRQKTVVILSIIGAICLIVFIAQNREKVEVDILFWKVNLSIIVLIFFSILFGGILTLAFYLPKRSKLKKELAQLKKKLEEKETPAVSKIEDDEENEVPI